MTKSAVGLGRIRREAGGFRLGRLGYAALVLSPACADSPPAEWSGSIRDSAGVTIVSNPAAGLWKAGEEWTLTEVLRIGSRDGDPQYQFGQISGIAELRDGRLAVFDAQAQHLRLFASDGTHDATVGGPGSGPGEFGPGAGPVLVGPGDSIFVPDPTNQRLHRFTPSGEPAGSSPLDFSRGLPMIWLDTPDGRLLNQVRPFFPGQTISDSTDVVLSRTSDGGVADTLIAFPSGRTFGTRPDGSPDFRFFSAEPIWTVTSTGKFVYGYSDEYRIGIYEGTRLTRVIEKPFTRDPVTVEDRRLLKEAMARVWRDLGMGGDVLQVMTDAIGFAERYPAHAWIRGGPGGSIWVQHLETPSDLPEAEREMIDPSLGFGAPVWDMFDPAGRFLGEIETPRRYMPLRIAGDRIYGVLRDELDVQYVLVLRVEWDEEDLESAG